MADREKIIKGLECLADRVSGCKSDCPYYASRVVTCFRVMAADALALLLEDAKPVHRPTRLMTKEEVLSQPEGAVVWRECHLSNGQFELRPMVCDGKGRCGDFGLSVECKYDFGCRYYVRYWTGRPTDEQREAVKRE